MNSEKYIYVKVKDMQSKNVKKCSFNERLQNKSCDSKVKS